MARIYDNEQMKVVTQMDDVMSVISKICGDRGMECHALKTSWYNDSVAEVFQLPYPSDTLVVLLISTPSMFEKLFKPFLSSSEYNQSSRADPLDQCLRNYFMTLAKNFPNNQVDIMQDFELYPTRRPKILVQTAGHVSGAARYYQRSDVNPDPWTEGEKIYGVSVHPKYGGWFALRGVLIFKDVLAPELEKKEPLDCVPTREKRIELLEKFNRCWQDWSYRDVSVLEITERYSEEQKQYFATEPGKRLEIVSSMISHTAY